MANSPKSHAYMTVEVKEMLKAFSLNCWFTVMDSWLLENEYYPNSYTEETLDRVWHIKGNTELTVGIIEYIIEYAEEQMERTQLANNRRLAVNRK